MPISDQGAIEVSNADGSSRSVLVHYKVDEPRAVAVDPIKRLVLDLKKSLNLILHAFY